MLHRVTYAFSILVWCSGCLPQQEPEVLPDAHRYSYSVPAELRGDFLGAARRIYDASGIVLHEHPKGTTVTMVHETRDKACGETYVVGYPDSGQIVRVRIDIFEPARGCFEDLSNTLLHELIHSLRREYGLLGLRNEDTQAHAESGIFAQYTNDHRLDEASLTMLCEAVPCTVFNPEE